MPTPPDAAAVAAAERSRGEFEAHRAFVEEAGLAAGITEIGRRVVAASPLLAAGQAATPLTEGWRFRVLDDPEPEAFLFADRTVFVSRGALAALPGEGALEALFRTAAATWAGGGFRSLEAGGLVEQPLRLILPVEDSPVEEPGSEPRSRDAWLDLLDGLLYGEPAEFGVGMGATLLLPIADVRLQLPPGLSFEAGGRGVFRAVRSGQPLGLTVREVPPPGDSSTAAFPEADSGSPASARTLIRGLGARLRALAESRGAQSSFVEVFRVRGFTGVRGRLRGEDDSLTLAALLRAPGSLVEVSQECAGRRFGDCEASLLEILGSADRLWDTPVPGSLRITALAAGEAGSVRDALGRLAAAGSIDGPLATVEHLNRAWLDEPLGPGERVLVLSRGGQPLAAGPEDGGAAQ